MQIIWQSIIWRFLSRFQNCKWSKYFKIHFILHWANNMLLIGFYYLSATANPSRTPTVRTHSGGGLPTTKVTALPLLSKKLRMSTSAMSTNTCILIVCWQRECLTNGHLISASIIQPTIWVLMFSFRQVYLIQVFLLSIATVINAIFTFIDWLSSCRWEFEEWRNPLLLRWMHLRRRNKPVQRSEPLYGLWRGEGRPLCRPK